MMGGVLRLVAGALIVCATSVSAQETGTLIKRNRAAQIDEGNPNAPRIAMEAFGACVLSRSKGRVAKFVDMRVGEQEYADYMRGLFDRSDDFCLSQGWLQFHDIHFRGALFQALYNSEFKSGPPSFGAVTTSNYRALYPETLSPPARNTVALEQFGECVARADPQGVHDLLRSLAGSSRETALFQQLSPRFSACIPQGEKLAFSKIVLKGALAEGMYRLSKAAEAAPPGGAVPAR
jgi:hypothetical protein